MTTNYGTEKVTAAIRKHLVAVNAIPPNAEPTRLASELTEIVWNELSNVGLSREDVENLFASPAPRARAQGRA